MGYLDDLQQACENHDWEDSDDMPISIVGRLGDVRRLLRVARAAEAWTDSCGCEGMSYQGGHVTQCREMREALAELEK